MKYMMKIDANITEEHSSLDEIAAEYCYKRY